MFENQIISALSEARDLGEVYPKSDYLIYSIDKSHKFHFGLIDQLPQPKADNDIIRRLRLPYSICCFDGFYIEHKSGIKNKFLYLVIDILGELAVFGFDTNNRPDRWHLMPVVRYDVPNSQYDSYSVYDINRRTRETEEWGMHVVGGISHLLLLLNCKNITTKEISKDKENLKRARKNLPPLYSYHVLQITSPGANKGEKPRILGQGKHRQHWCRGHFKHYTEEAPLFGKYTGLYYWEPHLRGDSKRGFADKDYEYVPPKEEE